VVGVGVRGVATVAVFDGCGGEGGEGGCGGVGCAAVGGRLVTCLWEGRGGKRERTGCQRGLRGRRAEGGG